MHRSTKRAAIGACLLAPASACLDRGHDGRAFEWKNVATSASGTIGRADSFGRRGVSCRGAAFRIAAGGETSDTAWNLCRTPQGWKFAEGR